MSTEIEIQAQVDPASPSPSDFAPPAIPAPEPDGSAPSAVAVSGSPEAGPAPGARARCAPGASGSKRAARKISARKLAANRANAQKSTGPRTERGKKRARLNGFARQKSVRLLGLAEARTLRQEPGAAERLYEELIAPYQPAPAVLAMHFQDLARLHLELEAWERIRDAQLEHRWQQNDVERRKRYQEMQSDLPGTAQDLAERGLCRMEATPARFKRQADCLAMLKWHLEKRDFDIEHILHVLWGKNLESDHDRAQTICFRCRKLMPSQDKDTGGKDPGARASRPPVTKKQLKPLIDLIDEEYRDTMSLYLLKLDEKTMTRFACLAGLGPTRDDHWMHLQGERLRRAIDRKQWVINGLLQTLHLHERFGPEAGSDVPGTGSL